MLLQKDLMCWTVEQSDVSWASMSINTKYCIVKTTNKILSVTGKIADNKLENIITEMLYPACNRIMWNLLHRTYCLAHGVFMHLFSHTACCVPLWASWHWDILDCPHIWFITILWQDRAIIRLWNCSALQVLSPPFWMEKWGRRCQEKELPCGLDSWVFP